MYVILKYLVIFAIDKIALSALYKRTHEQIFSFFLFLSLSLSGSNCLLLLHFFRCRCIFSPSYDHISEKRKKKEFTYFTAVHLTCLWRWEKIDPCFEIHMQIWSRTNIFAYILFIRIFSNLSICFSLVYFSLLTFKYFEFRILEMVAVFFSLIRLQIFAYKAKVYNNARFFSQRISLYWQYFWGWKKSNWNGSTEFPLQIQIDVLRKRNRRTYIRWMI